MASVSAPSARVSEGPLPVSGGLRLGVVLEGRLFAWQRHALEAAVAGGARVEVVVAQEPSAPASYGLLYRWYDGKDLRHKPAANDACAPAALPASLAAAERLEVQGTVPASGVVAALAGRDLDVVVVFAGLAGLDRWAEAARHGAWYVDHGEAQSGDGATAGLWEVLGRKPAIHAALRARQAGERSDPVLYESWSPIDRIARARTRSRHLWKVAHFLPRALRRLEAIGGEAFFREAAERGGGSPPVGRPPTNRRLLLPLLRYLGWRICRRLEWKRWRDRWILMCGPRDSKDFPSFRKLRPPAGRFWADPHAIRREGRTCIFFEDVDLANGRGRIAVLDADEPGSSPIATTIIERPWHYSYPFLLEWEGELYLIPESGDNGTVEVWRCRRFPDDWEFSHNLMSGVSLYDATLLPHEGRWWLFAAAKAHEQASSWDELCIFYADQPLSTEWRPHALNPVVSDVRRARPAGAFIRRDGRLLRPSQDSSHRYGYGLNFSEVLELTPTSYRERLVEALRPDFDPRIHALHSWSESGDLAVIDALERTRRRG